jgi:hypothetical protein
MQQWRGVKRWQDVRLKVRARETSPEGSSAEGAMQIENRPAREIGCRQEGSVLEPICRYCSRNRRQRSPPHFQRYSSLFLTPWA